MNDKKISGLVKSAELCTPLENVQVRRKDTHGIIIEETESDDKGYWKLKTFEPGDNLCFGLKGFVKKVFGYHYLPGIVRLLEDKLIGYQKRLWFRPGERVEVFVHSSVRFSAKLFRHGLKKECILHLGFFEKQIQRVPDKYFVEDGLEWEKSFNYKIPINARPGLYSLLLEAEKQEPFAMPFVVSTPEEQRARNSKLIVLASTNTWQSYNIWGGRNRYRSFENGGTKDYVNLQSSSHKIKVQVAKSIPLNLKMLIRHALRHWLKIDSFIYKKLTILRPFTNCDLEESNVYQPFTNHLAAGEWRVLAWLEREKIEYDIISGAELHQDPDLLKHYKAILFSTHCEYWSRQMYEGVKHYHERNGMWILNISGNTMYREIGFFEDGSTRCVSLSFAHSCADESKILGVRFTEDDLSTCAPYKIRRPDHWVFKGLYNNGQSNTFGELSLNRITPKKYSRYDPGRPGDIEGLVGLGASGWETDKLSASFPRDIEVVAKGLNKKGGADMVIRESNGSRGGMFSASSITFGGCLLVDRTASKLTLNVISKALNIW